MIWDTMAELGKAYGLAMGGGALLGSVIVLFNSWRV